MCEKLRGRIPPIPLHLLSNSIRSSTVITEGDIEESVPGAVGDEGVRGDDGLSVCDGIVHVLFSVCREVEGVDERFVGARDGVDGVIQVIPYMIIGGVERMFKI